jgi:hypothetical protein
MGSDPKKWEEAEKYLKLLANNPTIYYAKQIDIVDYITAFRNLKFSVDKNTVINPSAINVYFKINNTVYTVEAGTTKKLL